MDARLYTDGQLCSFSTDVPAEADIADHAGLHLFILKVGVFL